MPDDTRSAHDSYAPPAAIVFQRLEAHHVSETARLHMEHLGAGLFPRLGARFVRRWHQTFIDSPYACGFIATDRGGAVLGFVIGSTDQSKYVTHTVHAAKWPLALRGAAALAVRPRLAATFVVTRLRPYVRRMSRPEPTTEHSRPSIAVVHAVVSTPPSRGCGVGRLLLACYEEDVLASGTRIVELVTEAGPGGAGGFYRRLGWVEGQPRANKDGRMMLTFTRRITR